MISIDLCLSDIPNSACNKSDKNQKIYVSLILSKRQANDQFGNTHSLSVSQTKAERAANLTKVYCGSGKETEFSSSTSPAANPFAGDANIAPTDHSTPPPVPGVDFPVDDNSDLPF